MTSPSEEDIVVRLLHTADWHLGKRFPSFSEEHNRRLMQARLAVLDRIIAVAERFTVDAVLCAGDLFDEPVPKREWWEQVAQRWSRLRWTNRPVFLLPGNHDPMLAESVWNNRAFRDALPSWVHVVDRPDFEFPLSDSAVLYAVPCMSRAGQRDPTESIPERQAGDERVRIGMVHGIGNAVVLALFAASWWMRLAPDQPPSRTSLLLSFVAAGLLLLTGWLGGELVARLSVGVDERAHINATNSVRDHGVVEGTTSYRDAA